MYMQNLQINSAIRIHFLNENGTLIGHTTIANNACLQVAAKLYVTVWLGTNCLD